MKWKRGKGDSRDVIDIRGAGGGRSRGRGSGMGGLGGPGSGGGMRIPGGGSSWAFSTAEAVGDDRLQGRGGGRVNPDSFTHGTSEQRRRWFTRGYESGSPESCDTFSGEV